MHKISLTLSIYIFLFITLSSIIVSDMAWWLATVSTQLQRFKLSMVEWRWMVSSTSTSTRSTRSTRCTRSTRRCPWWSVGGWWGVRWWPSAAAAPGSPASGCRRRGSLASSYPHPGTSGGCIDWIVISLLVWRRYNSPSVSAASEYLWTRPGPERAGRREDSQQSPSSLDTQSYCRAWNWCQRYTV